MAGLFRVFMCTLDMHPGIVYPGKIATVPPLLLAQAIGRAIGKIIGRAKSKTPKEKVRLLKYQQANNPISLKPYLKSRDQASRDCKAASSGKGPVIQTRSR